MSANAYTDSRELVNAVVSDTNLLGVAERFGFTPSATSLDDRLTELQAFTNATFDFRGKTPGKYIERWQTAEPVEINEDEDLSAHIFEAARNIAGFNMVDSATPTRDTYDSGMILGGGNLSPLYRTSYFAEHIGSVGTIFLLGSGRPVNAEEKEKVADYAPNAEFEYDLMDGALRSVYDVTEIDEEQFGPNDTASRNHCRIRTYRTSSGIDIVSIWAPAIEGIPRANTADSYRYVERLDRLGELNTRNIGGIGRTVVSVTNAQFTFFQGVDFMHRVALANYAETEIIGFDASYGGMVRKPHELLQEMNSGVNSTVALHKTLTETQ